MLVMKQTENKIAIAIYHHNLVALSFALTLTLFVESFCIVLSQSQSSFNSNKNIGGPKVSSPHNFGLEVKVNNKSMSLLLLASLQLHGAFMFSLLS